MGARNKPQVIWTAAMVITAIDMRRAGASCKVIARVVGATPKAVSLKLNRCGVRKP